MPALATAGADQAADQRVRRGRRNAVVPGDQVPGDRADQRAEDDVVIDDRLVDDALADRVGDAEAKDEQGDEVEERRPRTPPGRGRSTRVDTTVAIEFAASWKPFMKSNASATTIRTSDVEPTARSCERSRSSAQAFSRTMPSMTLATSSHLSVIDSSSS